MICNNLQQAAATDDTMSLSSSLSNYETNSLNSNQKTTSGRERRKLPRTNPNYVNVDMIAKDGSIKSTYMRFDKNLNVSKQSLNANCPQTGFVNPLNSLNQNLSPTQSFKQKDEDDDDDEERQHQSPDSPNSIASALFFSLNNSKSSFCTNCQQTACICSSGYSFMTSSPLKPTNSTSDLMNRNSSISTSLHSPLVNNNNKTLVDDTNEFTSSSNTLCNYPFVDESLTTKLRHQQQQNISREYQSHQKSPLVKIKVLNNTISYPSLNRTTSIDAKTKNKSKTIH